MRPLIVIPARMASTRLPGKPLADIAGLPMIVQVWRRAMEADVGPVLVAAADTEIADAVAAAGGAAVMTAADHPSGSDRVHEAVTRVDPAGRHDAIINLQGDLPTIEPALIRTVLRLLDEAEVEIATLVTEIVDEAELASPHIVKAVLSVAAGARAGRALYFTRAPAPHGPGPHYHHFGIYAYHRRALDRFIGLPPAPLEQREKLEQLRALEAGMRIDAGIVDSAPFGVDTPADLERARRVLGGRAPQSPAHP